MNPSPRIKAIANMVRPEHELWDLCCDHGQIGLYAHSQNQSQPVYFVDINQDICHRLEQKLASYQNEHFHVFCLDAQYIRPATNADIIIAGVGNKAIINLLDALASKPLETIQEQRLIISTHADPILVRQKAKSLGWKLVREVLVKERKHYRQILALEISGKDIHPLSNSLHKDSPELFQDWYQETFSHMESIIAQGGTPRYSPEQLTAWLKEL